MAPEVAIRYYLARRKEVRFSLQNAHVDFLLLDQLKENLSWSDEKIIGYLDIASDEVTKKFLREKREKFTSWRGCKIKLMELARLRALEWLLNNRQKEDEKLSTWLERVIPRARGAGWDLEWRKTILIGTTYSAADKNTLIRHYADVKSNENEDSALYWIKYEEKLEERVRKKEENRERKSRDFSERKPEELKRAQVEEKEPQEAQVEEKEPQEVQVEEKEPQKVQTVRKAICNQLEVRKTVGDEKVKIKINGGEEEVILDPGSNVNIISRNLAEIKGLEMEPIPAETVENVFGVVGQGSALTFITVEHLGTVITVEALVGDSEKEWMLLGKPYLDAVEGKTKELEALRAAFPTVFNKTPSKGYQGIQCEIKTPAGRRVNMRSGKIPQAMLEEARKTIEEYVENEWLEESTSSWTNQLKVIMKPDGRVRLVMNMIFLNNLVEKNNYTVPHPQMIIEKTFGKKWFSVIDLKDGYFQILLKEEDRHKTAFLFMNKLYQWRVMPQGFKNSPAIFQAVMERVLEGLIGVVCVVYLDDILVLGETIEEHDKNMRLVLERLGEADLRVNWKKLQYRQRQVKFLGTLVDGSFKRPFQGQIEKVVECTPPRTIKALQRFLGLANYLHQYIPRQAELAAPLTEMLKGKSPCVVWNDNRLSAFEKLKEEIRNIKNLHMPDFTKPFVLRTDASNTGLGATLQQEISGRVKTIGWASRKLSEAEKKLGITEKEFLAVGWGIEYFDYYLRGKRFKVVTDHRALLACKTKENFGNLKLERMRMRLQQYDFDMEYVPGRELVDADALSRLDDQEGPYLEEELRSKRLLKDRDGNHFWKNSKGECRVLPRIEERVDLIKKAHETETRHGGIDATLYQIQKVHSWRGISEDVKEVIKNCDCCTRNDQKTLGGEEFVSTSKPMEIVAMDLLQITQQFPVLTFIDYYTRMVKAVPLESKEPSEVIGGLRKIFNELGTPEKIISDNGKEFVNGTCARFFAERKIVHHTVPPEKHQSNGRVERCHRDIWQYLRKMGINENTPRTEIEKAINEAVERHNKNFHRALGKAPSEVWEDPEQENAASANATDGKYAITFKKLKREKFETGQQVYVQALWPESSKKLNEKYTKEGKIVWCLDNDSYLVNVEGRYRKCSHSQLKENKNFTAHDVSGRSDKPGGGRIEENNE